MQFKIKACVYRVSAPSPSTETPWKLIRAPFAFSQPDECDVSAWFTWQNPAGRHCPAYGGQGKGAGVREQFCEARWTRAHPLCWMPSGHSAGQAELSVLLLPSQKTAVAEPLRTAWGTSLICPVQPRLDSTEWSSVLGRAKAQAQGPGSCGSASPPCVLQWWRRSTQSLHQNLFWQWEDVPTAGLPRQSSITFHLCKEWVYLIHKQ